MDTESLYKGLVILLLISALISLFSGLFCLVRDQGQTERTLKSLSLRIAISLALFLVLFVGLATGLIRPHGLPASKRVSEPGQQAP